jgi:dehypoxanthine futalosine cyclase
MRISFEEGLELFKKAPLEELRRQAHAIRETLAPEKRVTFILDSNPNYTNICQNRCLFCAFWREGASRQAYSKTPEEVMAHFEAASLAGASQVLLQGGIHEKITIDYLCDLVRLARLRFPTIHPHFFSAPEIYGAAIHSKISTKDALGMLYEAGLRTIPGGGAEILSERVRQKISPLKISSLDWIRLHLEAHEIGFRTTATMMYGHIEEPLDILIHFERLRAAQDRTNGFLSFIPWSFKKNNTALAERVTRSSDGNDYLRMIAFARIYLDNFPHIGGSWFSEGKEVGIRALQSGADDFGGTLFEENVHRACDYINRTNFEEVLAMIRKAGYRPAERNAFYEIMKDYPLEA